MNPEAADAIQIADKHLAGEPPAKRNALAQDILSAIMRHAERVAADAISKAFATQKAPH